MSTFICLSLHVYAFMEYQLGGHAGISIPNCITHI